MGADSTTRNDFVRKVYGILGLQLSVTTVIAGAFVRHGREALHAHPGVVMAVVVAACLMSLCTMCIFTCFPGAMRTSPWNYGLLGIFTMAESVLVGMACIQYTQASVLFCFG